MTGQDHPHCLRYWDRFSHNKADAGTSTASTYIALLTNPAFTGSATPLACVTQKGVF
jgi:hypothetical protein